MTEALLFLFFVIFPFFRIFQGALLENVHNIIAVGSVSIVLLGILFNKLDDYINKLIRYLIPLLISTIAVHFFLKTYDSAQIKITLLEIGGPLVLLIWIIKRINIGNFKIAAERKYVLLPAVLFLFSGIISFLLSQFKLETFEPGLLRRISYLGVFLVTVFEFNREDDFKRILNWVLASCALVVVYGFIQIFGLDWHIWKGAFAGTFSTFGNPNFYAAWIVLVLPLVLSRLMIERKWYYAALALGILINIYYTGTKGSWVGLGVEFSIFIILSTLYLIKGNPKKLKKVAVGMTLAILIVVSAGVTWFSVKRITSIRFRLFTWGATMKMISEPIFVSPLKAVILGHGIETFKLVYPSYRRPEIFHIEGKHNTETDHAHNEFMEVFYDEGIIGLTIFLWLMVSIFYGAFKRLSLTGMGGAQSKDEFYLVGLIAGTAGMLAHASVSVHVRFVSSGYILWTFLGLLVVHSAPFKKVKEEKINQRTGPLVLLMLAVLTAGAYNSFHASRRFLANIYHNRAIAYSKQRMWDQALLYYKKVQEYHPSFIMAYYFEGNVYNDRLSEALQKKNQKEIELYYNKAIETYRKVRTMYPNYVQLHFQEGMLHLKVGKVEEAVKSFRKYMNIVDPVYPFTYYRLGMIYARKNDLLKAQWYFEEPPRRQPKYVDSYLNLANIYIVQQKYVLAEQTYLEALQTRWHKNSQKIYASLAGLYEKWGKKEKAVQTYRKLQKLRPKDKSIGEKIRSLQKS